jgi:hypothetical protein
MQKTLSSYIAIMGAVFIIPLGSANAQTFKPTHHLSLKLDGPNIGDDAYKIIQKALGDKAIEAPDIYTSNHSELKHIVEGVDAQVGPHLIFLAHRDDDHDRDKGVTDRQRNEIKAYGGSRPGSLAYKGDVMQYRWKFKIDKDFGLSKSFTHFFQVKAKNSSKKRKKNGGDAYPVLTVSAVDLGEKGREFQLRYSTGLGPNGEKAVAHNIIREDLSRFTDIWVDVVVQVEFNDKGKLHFQAKNLETGERLAVFKSNNIDMWRGESKRDYSRPKWGIYRSLKHKDSLSNSEDKLRIADLSITKGKWVK